MLGKIQPEQFPKVFGPNADQPHDAAVVQQKFTALAEEIAAATGKPLQSPEEVAEGFLRIAVENMAKAIKKSKAERRVGKECDNTCRSRWSPDNEKKK